MNKKRTLRKNEDENRRTFVTIFDQESVVLKEAVPI